MEGRAGGEVEMTPGERAGAAEASTSVAEANAPPSVAAKLTVLVPAASDRTPGSGSGDASVPETPLAGSGRSREEEEEEGGRRRARDGGVPVFTARREGPPGPERPELAAEIRAREAEATEERRVGGASAATRATSTESVAVVVAG
jgi:hypothetical protein